jgi:uncharacterized protein
MAMLDDLRQVIRRIETRRPPRPRAEAAEHVLGAELVQTAEGPILVARNAYALDHRHGRYPVGDGFALSERALRVVARPGDAPADPRDLLFVDVETTGLAGGTGTYAFLVGVGALEGDRFVVTQYFMRDLDEERALLAALAPRLEAARGIVTFNGGAFDVPLLETRFILARRRWPVPLPHVDLLRPARRVWLASVPDCRLSTLEREALGLVRDGDVPGALIPTLYFQFLRTRQARPLARVFVHNRQDVLSLVTLLGWFARALGADADRSLSALEQVGLGRLWERHDPERSLAHYRAALARGLTGRAWLWTCLRLAAWQKRRDRWEEACALWESATRAGSFDPRPWEELAKFHEHRRRDTAAARQLVMAAVELARGAGASAAVLEAFRYRLGRLERRLSAPRPL